MDNESVPRRGIYNDVDMKSFMESSTRKELLNFVEAMGKSCTVADEDGMVAFDPANALQGLPPSMACLHGALRQMVTWIEDFPPTNPDSCRFGNPAFHQWHARLVSRSTAILTAVLECRDDKSGASNEEYSQKGWDAAAGAVAAKDDPSILQVSCYLHDSFGHAARLDYGTGHESSFAVFLLVLSKVKCLGKDMPPKLPTLRNVTLSIFDQYLKVTRRLQTDYRLEPAGSHGVWGLDDYHCLPFYFGACQLQALSSSQDAYSSLEFESLTHPKVVNDEDMIKDYGDQFLYLACIRYIRQLKKGVPFFESSPMLYDISQTMPTWDKVARGMLRLYQGEVLDKRQVVQHFLFSKLFPMTWTPSQLVEREAPVETFRAASGQRNSNPEPKTRAPWARRPTGGGADLSPTRAPWTVEASEDDPMAPTKAPWAK